MSKNSFMALEYSCSTCKSRDISVDSFGNVMPHASKNTNIYRGVCKYKKGIQVKVASLLTRNKKIGK